MTTAVAGLRELYAQYSAQRRNSVGDHVLARRNQFHQERLGSHITGGKTRRLAGTVDGLTQQLQHGRHECAIDAINGDSGRVSQNLQLQASLCVLDQHLAAARWRARRMFCMKFV